MNRIGGVMVSVLASSAAVDRWVRAPVGQTKDFKIGICCFSAKHHEARSIKEKEQGLVGSESE